MRRLVLALLFAACASQANTANTTNNTTPVPAAANAPSTHGQSFEKKDTVQVSMVAKDAAPYLNQTIQLEGKVSAVCQNKGCWMELTDDATKTKVRIIAKDHSFGVPKDCSGKTVVANGILTSKDLPQEDAAHFAKEAGQPEPTGPVKELQLEATGVMIL